MTFRTLAAGFVRSVERFPERTALEVDGHAVTYSELSERSSDVAEGLLKHDPGGSRTALLSSRSLDTYAGMLGALLAGRGYVPLPKRFPAERLQTMLDLSGATALIVGEECLELLPNVLADRTIPLEVLLPKSADLERLTQRFPSVRFFQTNPCAVSLRELPWTTAGPDEVAYLMFTSGSTGVPKGVPVRHKNVRAYLDYFCDRYQVDEHDRFAQVSDVGFDLSVHDIFFCWEVGACLCVLPDAATMAPGPFIREEKITAWLSVPSVGMILSRLKMLEPGAFPSLRLTLFCGEALPESVAEQWQVAAPASRIENIYGPTEATIAITHYPWNSETSPRDCRNGVVPIGVAFPGHSTRLLPVEAELDAGDEGEEAGELCLSGPQVTDGYLSAPDKTREQFVVLPDTDDVLWYRTGDFVRKDASGCLHFGGRIDNQVKIQGGYRVELPEIEEVLRQLVGTSEVVCLGWPVRQGVSEGVVAFVAGVARVDERELAKACRQRLPSYMVPKHVYFVETFPLNNSGKIDRRALSASLEAGNLERS